MSVLKLYLKEEILEKKIFFFDWHNFNSTALSFYLHYPITLTSEDAEKGKKISASFNSYCELLLQLNEQRTKMPKLNEAH